MKLEGNYNPKEFEDKLYNEWEEKGYFKPNNDKTRENYCIMMPPPNVTGKLHMGHALDGTIQDILIRFKRMLGFNTLWLPGTDHAAIATEVKVVEYVDRVVNNYNGPVTNAAAVNDVADTYVFFAFNSDVLDDRAKAELDKIGQNGIYDIIAFASNEGSKEYNLALSQRRADAVKAYLEDRGCKINSAVGKGVQFGLTTGRVAIVSVMH